MSQVVFEPAQLLVVGNTALTARLTSEERQAIYPFAQDPEVRLTVLVTSPGRSVTGIWTGAIGDSFSELYEFVDDTGANLLANGGGESGPEVSEDWQAASFEITSRTAPSASATRISARGRIRVSTANGVRKEVSQPAKVEKGAVVDVAGFRFKMELKGRQDGAIREITFQRKTKRDQLRMVATVLFENEQGEKLDYRHSSTRAHGINDEMEVEDTYFFREPPAELRVVVELWEDRIERDEEFTVECTVGCGL